MDEVTTQRWREAVHEAGHAMMAVLLGRAIDYVSLAPRPETRLSSPTRLPKSRPEDSSERAHLEGEAMLALAGLTAERVLGVAAEDSLAMAAEDLAVASRVAVLTVGRARAEKAVAHHLAVVERMLERRKDTALKLARALVEAGRLGPDEIHAIVPRQ